MHLGLTGRWAKGALAVATGSLLLAPAGVAYADPAPVAPNAAVDTTPSEEGNPNSVLAQQAGVCDDAEQIGDTHYIDVAGSHIASLKHFKSEECDADYAYLWVWDDFRNSAAPYDVDLSIYGYDTDNFYGPVSGTNTKQQEWWSEGAATTNMARTAVGKLRVEGNPLPYRAITGRTTA